MDTAKVSEDKPIRVFIKSMEENISMLELVTSELAVKLSFISNCPEVPKETSDSPSPVSSNLSSILDSYNARLYKLRDFVSDTIKRLEI